MDNISIIVLAAGKGTRMKQNLPKVLTRSSKDTLINHVLSTAAQLKPANCTVVVGFKADEVQSAIENSIKEGLFSFPQINFAEQKEQLGTGHACQVAWEKASANQIKSEQVLILYGDVPLISLEQLKDLQAFHHHEQNTISILSLNQNIPGYGKIIRQNQQLTKITEYKDCNAREKYISETNSGIYLVDSAFLGPALSELSNDNAQGEYYLTDIIEKAFQEGQKVDALMIDDSISVQGVNTPADLQLINQHLKQEKIKELSDKGVLFADPGSVFIDQKVEIDGGTFVGPGVQIYGESKIGANNTLEGYLLLRDVKIGNQNNIKLSCRIEAAEIGNECMVGPFAQLRPQTKLENQVKVGNFVELKKVKMAENSKANHLTYLGDSEIGKDVNIGAGTITCNYDGFNKFTTIIEEGAFIGSNSSLIAPVRIGAGAYVGSGSSISKNVEENALVLTRAERKELKQWAKKFRDKNSSNKKKS